MITNAILKRFQGFCQACIPIILQDFPPPHRAEALKITGTPGVWDLWKSAQQLGDPREDVIRLDSRLKIAGMTRWGRQEINDTDFWIPEAERGNDVYESRRFSIYSTHTLQRELSLLCSLMPDRTMVLRCTHYLSVGCRNFETSSY